MRNKTRNRAGEIPVGNTLNILQMNTNYQKGQRTFNPIIILLEILKLSA